MENKILDNQAVLIWGNLQGNNPELSILVFMGG